MLPTLAMLGLSISVTPAVVPAATAWKPGANIALPPMPQKAPAQPVDLAALAQVIAESAPTLQFVTIDLSSAPGATSSDRAWFQVHETGRTTRRMEKTSAAEGAATVARMRAFNRFD